MGRGGGMEGAGKDWLGDAHDEFTPSNDQTRTTKAQNARFPLAAFPSRDAPSADAAKFGHARDGKDLHPEQAHGGAAPPQQPSASPPTTTRVDESLDDLDL